MTPPRVETAGGALEGATVRDTAGPPVHRFLGVPYAAPPVGLRRWSPPGPASPWAGRRAADTYGPAALQRGGMPSVLPAFRPDAVAEDCLTLNVWTPGLTGARPVMVWIHGGAFVTGGSSQPVYDAARLAGEHDVVVVTLNYRLGALGFLALDDATPGGDVVANAGLHDQLAALAWVRDHAAVFGGDARTVTVFGESAGAGSILHLMSAALPHLPFARAIVQSGEPRTLDRAQAAAVAAAFATAVGVERADAAHLRAVPVEALLDAQEQVAMDLVATTGAMPFAPTVDGGLLDQDVRASFDAGRGVAVDLVLGTTRDELRLFPDPSSATLDDDRLRRRVARLVPHRDPGETLAVYRAVLGAEASSGDVWEAVRTDAMMRVPNLRLGEARAAAGVPAYLYRFDWAAPGVGAIHAVDVPFTFGTFEREGWGDAVGSDRDAAAMASHLRTAWATFARSGQPVSEGLGPRPAYEPPRRPTMLFGRQSGAADDPDGPVRRHYG